MDRANLLRKAFAISLELKRCVRDFDAELGDVIRTLCPDPSALSEEGARDIVLEYSDVLWRACAGTTLAAALVNLEHQLVWALNVGNSTVG